LEEAGDPALRCEPPLGERGREEIAMWTMIGEACPGEERLIAAK